MSITDNGDQSIFANYRYSSSSRYLNKLNYQVLKPGIYDGGTLTIDTGDDIFIGVFNALFQSSTGEATRITTSTPATLTIAELTPYVTASFAWADSLTNYLDFTAKALGDITSTDIVFGKGVYSVSVLTSFDYTEKTNGLFDQSGNIFGNTLKAVGTDVGTLEATTITNETELSSGNGVGSIVLQGTGTTADSDGFIKIMVGTTAVYVPYFTDIVGV